MYAWCFIFDQCIKDGKSHNNMYMEHSYKNHYTLISFNNYLYIDFLNSIITVTTYKF